MSIKLYKNPEYDKKIKFYEMAEEMYEGDQECLKSSKYLWLHELERKPEGAGLRLLRETRSSYTNFVEPFISIWSSLFFKKDPVIGEETRTLLEEQDLINNIDGEGTSFFSFVQNKILLNALLYGTPIVRGNALGNKPANLKEQQESKDFRPYLEIIEPEQFIDWAVEKSDPARLNKLNFCRLQFEEQAIRSSASDPIESKHVSIEYRVVKEAAKNKVVFIRYEKESGKEEEKESWKVVSEMPMNGWTEIPFAVQLNGISWVKDLLPHVLKYYNLESVLDNICLFQAHQRIFFAGDLEGMEMVVAAEYSYAPLPKDTQVITVDPPNAVMLENRLTSVLNNIFRIALNQTRAMSTDSKAVQAADSAKQEKETMYDLIKSEAESIESLVNQSLSMIAEFKGMVGFKPDFKFNLESLETDIEAMIQLVMLYRDDLQKLPTARKQLINNALSSLNVSQSKELEQEIETLVNTPANSNPEIAIKDRLLSGFNNRGN
jgi:hypothetical protein